MKQALILKGFFVLTKTFVFLLESGQYEKSERASFHSFERWERSERGNMLDWKEEATGEGGSQSQAVYSKKPFLYLMAQAQLTCTPPDVQMHTGLARSVSVPQGIVSLGGNISLSYSRFRWPLKNFHLYNWAFSGFSGRYTLELSSFAMRTAGIFFFFSLNLASSRVTCPYMTRRSVVGAGLYQICLRRLLTPLHHLKACDSLCFNEEHMVDPFYHTGCSTLAKIFKITLAPADAI